LREGNPGFALALLRKLETSVPGGALVEERAAVATIARCLRDERPFGVDLAGDFAETYPASVYGQRVSEACAVKAPATDLEVGGDSTPRKP